MMTKVLAQYQGPVNNLLTVKMKLSENSLPVVISFENCLIDSGSMVSLLPRKSVEKHFKFLNLEPKIILKNATNQKLAECTEYIQVDAEINNTLIEKVKIMGNK